MKAAAGFVRAAGGPAPVPLANIASPPPTLGRMVPFALPRWQGFATRVSAAASSAAAAAPMQVEQEEPSPAAAPVGRKNPTNDEPSASTRAQQQRRGAAGRGSSSNRKKAERAEQLSALLALPQRVSVLPGVGPKYEQLLRAHNISTVNDLMKVHMLGHGRRLEVTAQFLKEKVGINNVGCVRSITAYLAQQQQDLDREVQQWASQLQQDEQGGSAAAAAAARAGAAEQEVPSWLQPKVTLSVEGNISAGKSTFLRILEGKGLLDSKLQVVPEPIDKWQNVGQGQVNLLMEFYKAPERFAYTFQNYVFLTRMMQERESYTAAAMCRLLERSVFSDKMVFVRSVHAAHYMSDTELAIYNSWFDPVLSTLPTLVPNGFIYLRATPQTCHKRLQRRARQEESTVQLEYLEDLHSKHEDWLYEGGDPVPASTSAAAGDQYIWVAPTRQVLTSSSQVPPASAAMGGPLSHLRPGLSFSIHDRLPDWRQRAPSSPSSSSSSSNSVAAREAALIAASRLPPVPPELDRAIRFLDTSRGEHMHPYLHTIPALVLDCDADVDVDRDEVYKAHLATQVSKYCDYVRQCMVARANAVVGHEQRLASALQQQQGSGVVLPQGGGVLGVSFPPSGAFNGYSLDVQGTTLYMDPAAPLVAFASQEARQVASASAAAAASGRPLLAPAQLANGGTPASGKVASLQAASR